MRECRIVSCSRMIGLVFFLSSFWVAHTFRVRSFRPRLWLHQGVVGTGANAQVFAVQSQVSSCEEKVMWCSWKSNREKQRTNNFVLCVNVMLDWLICVCAFHFLYFVRKNICKEIFDSVFFRIRVFSCFVYLVLAYSWINRALLTIKLSFVKKWPYCSIWCKFRYGVLSK